MQFSLSPQNIRLDSIVNAALARLMRKNRNHKLTQSWWLLRQILYQLYWRNPFQLYITNPLNAWSKISQAALAAKVGLSREWTNKLIRRLREDEWIETDAPRKGDGKQETTTFRPGGKLKQLLVGMQKSPQNNRVKSEAQSFPNSEKSDEKKGTDRQFLSGLAQGVAEKRDMNKTIRW